MAAAQRRHLTRAVGTVYAWIATTSGREELITVDLPVPAGIGTRPLLLVSDSRAEAMRYAPHARRHLEAIQEGSGPQARVDLRAFQRTAPQRPL